MLTCSADRMPPPDQAAKHELDEAREEVAEMTRRLTEAEHEAAKQKLLLQHIHMSAAADPSRLLSRCAALDQGRHAGQRAVSCSHELAPAFAKQQMLVHCSML